MNIYQLRKMSPLGEKLMCTRLGFGEVSNWIWMSLVRVDILGWLFPDLFSLLKSPSCVSSSPSVPCFSFQEKAINCELPKVLTPTPTHLLVSIPIFSIFSPVTLEELSMLLSKAKLSTCVLLLLPTKWHCSSSYILVLLHFLSHLTANSFAGPSVQHSKCI